MAKAPRGITPVSKKVRPRKPPTGVIRPTGQKRFGVTNNPVMLGGPGRTTYGGFQLTGNTSLDEWPPYWALLKLLGPPRPGLWQYQGKIGTGLPGASKPDFIIESNPLRPTIVRVQTPQYHVGASSFKAAYDVAQRVELEKQGHTVVDIYSQYYLLDNFGPRTGRAAIATMQDAMRGVQRTDPRVTHQSTKRV